MEDPAIMRAMLEKQRPVGEAWLAKQAAEAAVDVGPVHVNERFRLAQDDSCHWYLIPADRATEWGDWVYSEEAELGGTPEWASRLNGYPGLVTFEKPEED